MYTEICSCPLCGKKDNDPFAFEEVVIGVDNQKLGINICKTCGLNYVSPRLNRDGLTALYDNTYCETVSGIYSSSMDTSKHEYTQFSHYADRFLSSGGCIMDVGCGTGNFLSLLMNKPKYKIEGVEYSEHAGEQARKKGLEVRIGDLTVMDISPNSYDLCVMLYVLEHVSNPHPMLEKIWEILKIDGLLMIAVPNYKYLRIVNTGIVCRLCYGKQTNLHAEEHLQNFTPQTLSKMLEKAAFETVYWGMAKPLAVGSPFFRTVKMLGNVVFRALFLFGIHMGGIHCVARKIQK